MKFRGTRNAATTVSLSEAIRRGIAPDGGLYVPESLPRIETAAFDGLTALPDIARRLLEPFFDGDPLAGQLAEICSHALDFPVPLRSLRPGTAVLELFHGPTAAFKDVGARFLAECLSRLGGSDDRPILLLVATSGDTGGAVAAAFHNKPGIEVVVLYPRGRVSPRQEKQLTAWGGNVRSFAVRGDFDDCQRLVKQALANDGIRERFTVTSANSINLGRLLPQMSYYAAASLAYSRENGVWPGFIVPSGNLGNAVACLWAKAVGLPIREVVLATNANPVLADFTSTGEWNPRPTVETLATAMDVGSPSNMERAIDLFGGWDAAHQALRAFRVTDDEIRARIAAGPAEWGEIWDPHTATAVEVRARLDSSDWILVATAHPAKFEQIVEPLVGHPVEVPPALDAILQRPSSVEEIGDDLDGLLDALDA